MSTDAAFAMPDDFLQAYITDIPWENTSALAFSLDKEGYLQSFKRALGIVSDSDHVPDNKISFYSDVWDFRPYIEFSNASYFSISFLGCSDEMKNYMKFYALYRMGHDIKISTLSSEVPAVAYIINSTLALTNKTSFFELTDNDIIQFIDKQRISKGYKKSLYRDMITFTHFLETNYNVKTGINIVNLHKKFSCLSSCIGEHKLPNIPQAYYNDIVNTSVQVLHDGTKPYTDRTMAGAILLLAETGLRISEIAALKTNSIHVKRLRKINKRTEFIHYVALKPSPVHGKLLEFDIFCTKRCSDAFHTLLKLRAECPLSKTTDFLIVLPEYANKPKTKEFPVSTDRLKKRYDIFVETYLPDDCYRSWDEAIRPSKGVVSGKIVYIPVTEQFRVHVCSVLYNVRHVNLEWIRRFMGHLSGSMLGYYVRPDKNSQEDNDVFKQVLSDIHDNGLKPLGGDNKGSELARRINEFLDENHINVAMDAQDLADKVQRHIVIRAKTGGFCIKASIMPCEYDIRTDEVMCAANLCPNLFHFYFNADVSYTTFRNLCDSFSFNKNNGHTRAAQKELNKIHAFLRNRLIPELDEMDSDIQKNGQERVLSHYPSLENIIKHEAEIRKEISEWQKKSSV